MNCGCETCYDIEPQGGCEEPAYDGDLCWQCEEGAHI